MGRSSPNILQKADSQWILFYYGMNIHTPKIFANRVVESERRGRWAKPPAGHRSLERMHMNHNFYTTIKFIHSFQPLTILSN